ncbi:L-selenocysteine selenide-lyase (L-alanine-forming) [Paraburkholderia sp. BL6669N2]|uniref:cysteine desulfurase n=1 Tax=Paraburkholderia sp. BL6669N2 TaxID=1938807 RepID=UPI000E24E60C|nr:cysteine desulfurase [Paraburkholderia sp. BL6669N2]REG48506.1 L-selenocysteine selenide-lyase (L-alanine-forming) [Paraburkholderia sp. BL6669N2]
MKPIEQIQTPDPRNVEHWRADFPILGERVYGRPLVYLDNGATTQKPASVIYAENAYYRHNNANVHRGVHLLSQRATDSFEAARAKIARFINAQRPEEIVFVRGTTEAINLVAQSYARPQIKPGDEILISAMEHHSNIVPWQLVCGQTGAALKVVPIDDTGALDADAYERLLSERTRLVAMTHLANALGSINAVERIVAAAHARGVPVLLDGAQAIAHLPVDVRAIDCDFYAFSGHKVYGPTGIGVLYAKAALLEAMPPWQGGGDMIRSVTFEKTEYNAIPWKFEAGTPNIAGAIALGAALGYVDSLGMEVIAAHENELLAYATDALRVIPGLRFIGSARNKASILSFVLDGVHAHDVGTILDHHGVAVRAGHHCAMPVMQRFGVPATVRASLALYNTHQDIDALMEGLGKVKEIFGT